MTEEEEEALKAKLAQLRKERGDLDAAISESAVRDEMQLTRLKKRKLQLKDQIARIEDELLPDITA